MKSRTSTAVLDQYWLVHRSVSYAQANRTVPHASVAATKRTVPRRLVTAAPRAAAGSIEMVFDRLKQLHVVRLFL